MMGSSGAGPRSRESTTRNDSRHTLMTRIFGATEKKWDVGKTRRSGLSAGREDRFPQKMPQVVGPGALIF